MHSNRWDVDAIRSRIGILQVVGHYLELHKQGAAYVGLCPFHADKHPSLQVNEAKGLYHCFSCGAGGDAFAFVKGMEGCSFPEAVRISAGICHLPLPSSEPLPVRKEPRPEEPEAPAPTVEENERFWQTLPPYDPGVEELKETYAAFGVRVAPRSVPKPWWFTQGRIVFPIHNAEGQLVAFAARYQGADSKEHKIAKYLNSHASTRYKKGELLYAWHRAEKEIRVTGTVFLVEGYKDALAMHAAGFTNTVALCGVAFTDHHLQQVCRTAHTACLFLDADERGRQTADELLPRLLKAGLQTVDILPGEGGKDPDEMFRLLGRKAFAGWVCQAQVSPLQRRAEALLASACMRWPDTCCLTADGARALYRVNIRQTLEADDLLPEIEPYRRALLLTAEDKLPDTITKELFGYHPDIDRMYEQYTVGNQQEEVRHSELVQFLFLSYLEIRLAKRLRTYSLHSSDLSALQYTHQYLCSVSKGLGRRG